MTEDHEQAATIFTGRTITEVGFVGDYIQIHFDYAVLSAITDPVVIIGDTEYRRGDGGFCDRLIGCIGRNVTGESVIEGEAIRIVLDDKITIVISLQDEDRAEAATFFAENHKWWVW